MIATRPNGDDGEWSGGTRGQGTPLVGNTAGGSIVYGSEL